MKNILFAGIFHETNCFLQEKTRMKDFDILKKNEIFELKGDCSQVSGFIDFSLSNNLNIIPIVNYTATPSGIVEDEVLEYFWQEFERESNEIKSTKFIGRFWSNVYIVVRTRSSEST